VSSLAIGTTFTTDDSISFDATYTSPSRIVLTLSVDGSGSYLIGAPYADVTNDTGASFPSFYALLVGAPAGVTFNAAGWQDTIFPNGTTFSPAFPHTTQVTYNGPPGIGVGDSTDISVGFTTTDSGSQTFEVVLTPTVASVPEPATWAMMLAGFGGLGAVVRPRRRMATVSA
jgi:hypothetical protein